MPVPGRGNVAILEASSIPAARSGPLAGPVLSVDRSRRYQPTVSFAFLRFTSEPWRRHGGLVLVDRSWFSEVADFSRRTETG